MAEENSTDKARAYVFELMHCLSRKGGSDLYVTAGSPPVVRVGEELNRIGEEKLMPPQTMALATSLMDQRLRDEFMETSECNFAVSVPNVSRFRVNAYIQRGSASMVIRQISTNIPSLEELRMPPVLKDLVMAKRGLVMLVGATGQGKSTTMAALVDHRNSNADGHIITIEDPVEFIHSHKRCLVSQREVGTDTESFAIALRNALRQAPDVILIGEIRDRETMERALEIAETGHLCLCTLHANNTNQAMERVASFFPSEDRSQLMYELSLNLRAVVSQRLVRKNGVVGRVPAVEVLMNTPLMTELIAKGDLMGVKSLMAKSRELGMQTFDQSLYDLSAAGLIDKDEAIRNADSPNDLRLRFKLGNADKEGLSDTGNISLQNVEDSPTGRHDHAGQVIRR